MESNQSTLNKTITMCIFVAVNMCDNHECQNGGVCIDHTFSYECDCKSTGYVGPRCGHSE